MVSQHHADALRPHAASSAATLFAERHRCSDLEARGVLGRFGFGRRRGDAAVAAAVGRPEGPRLSRRLDVGRASCFVTRRTYESFGHASSRRPAAGLRDFDGAVCRRRTTARSSRPAARSSGCSTETVWTAARAPSTTSSRATRRTCSVPVARGRRDVAGWEMPSPRPRARRRFRDEGPQEGAQGGRAPRSGRP